MTASDQRGGTESAGIVAQREFSFHKAPTSSQEREVAVLDALRAPFLFFSILTMPLHVGYFAQDQNGPVLPCR